MPYIQSIVEKSREGAKWKRNFYPESSQVLFGTSPQFDITSQLDANRIEIWESPSGPLSKDQALQILFNSAEYTKDTIITTTVDTTLYFGAFASDRLLVELTNNNTIDRSVQVLSTLEDTRIELIRVPVSKIYTLEIASPYSDYKLVVPSNFVVKFLPYRKL